MTNLIEATPENLAALRAAYLKLITGKSETRVEIDTQVGRRSFQFARANLEELKTQIKTMDAQLNGAAAPYGSLSVRTSKGL